MSLSCNPTNVCVNPCVGGSCQKLYCDPDCGCDYNRKVYKNYCETKDCAKAAPDVFYPKQDAVVKVYSGATITTGPTGITLVATGFLISRKDPCDCKKSHIYVVTTSVVAMVPQGVTRVPPPPTGYTGFARMATFYVEVQNVNGCCKNYIYQAELIGIDGAGLVAILKINMDYSYNKNNPCIKKKHHPILDFEYLAPKGSGCDYTSCSRMYATGDDAFVMVKSNANPTTIREGIISLNRYNPTASHYFEGILFDGPFLDGDEGAPLINKRGKVIGIVTEIISQVDTRTIAVSEFSALPAIEAFTGGMRGDCNKQLQTVPDQLGSYFRYIKGYLGMDWHYTTALDFLPYSGNTLFKQIEGIVVTNIYSDSPFAVGLTGVTLPIIITHMNNCPLGQIAPQITPAAILSRLGTNYEDTLNPYDVGCSNQEYNISICFRPSSTSYNTSSCIQARSVDIPTALDNPDAVHY